MARALAGTDEKAVIQSIYVQLDKVAKKQLVKAQADCQAGRADLAIDTWQAVISGLVGRPVASKAKAQLARAAEKHPAVRASLNQLKAKKLLLAARATIEARRKELRTANACGPGMRVTRKKFNDVDAVAAMPPSRMDKLLGDLAAIVKLAPKTATAKQAGKLLKQIQADKKIMLAASRYRNRATVSKR